MRETDWDRQLAAVIIARFSGENPEERGTLLPMLHAIQHAIGFVPPGLVPDIAHALNLSRAEVHGVISFYHDFRTVPAGRHVVKLCRAESCQARGAAAIEALAESLLNTKMGTTRDDHLITLEPVYCLGLCAIGPNALVDDLPVAGLDAAAIAALATKVNA
jgi:formate dehydrogenase subunit gamma